MRWRTSSWVVLWLLACAPRPGPAADARLLFLAEDERGTLAPVDSLTLGPLPVDAPTLRRTLVLANVGDGAVTVDDVRLDGAPAAIRLHRRAGGGQLSPRSQLVLELELLPDAPVGTFDGAVVARTAEDTVRLPVTVRRTAAACLPLRPLSVGAIEIGGTLTIPLPDGLTDASEVAQGPTLTVVRGAGAVALRWQPTWNDDALDARVTVHRDGCPPRTLHVEGMAVSTCVGSQASPAQLPRSAAGAPPTSVTLTWTNHCGFPVTATARAVSLGVGVAVSGPSTVTLPAGSPSAPSVTTTQHVATVAATSPGVMAWPWELLSAAPMTLASTVHWARLMAESSRPQALAPEPELDLGDVPVGTAVRWSFRVQNGGLGTLSLLPGVAQAVSGSADELAVEPAEVRVAARAWGELPFALTALTPGLKSFRVPVSTNAAGQAELWLSLRARAVALSPCADVVVEPTRLDFGVVTAAFPAPAVLRLTAQGAPGTRCVLHGARTGSTAFRVELPADRTLEVGRPATLLVVPVPQAPAIPRLTDTLTVRFSASTMTELTVPLVGSRDEGCLSASATELALALSPTCLAPTSRELSFINHCRFPVKVQRVLVEPPTAALTLSPVPASLMVAPDEQLRVQVRADGPADAVVRVDTDEQGAPRGLTALVRARQLTSDTWTQDVRVPLEHDLLFVKEPDAVPELRDLGPLFAAELELSRSDTRVAVLRTDVQREPGRFQPAPDGRLVLGRSAGLAMTLRDLLDPSAHDGDTQESVLWPLRVALSARRVSSVRPEFVRPGAELHVVASANELDQSPQRADAALAFLESLAGPRRLAALTLNVVTYPSFSSDQLTLAYAPFTARLAGQVLPWTDVAGLQQLAHRTCSGPRTQLFVTDAPDVVGVAVNGQPVPPDGLGLGWSVSGQQLRFPLLWAPEPGDVVTLTRRPRCGP